MKNQIQGGLEYKVTMAIVTITVRSFPYNPHHANFMSTVEVHSSKDMLPLLFKLLNDN